MIRFSAALVAVAIGVLIGGIAASRLLLVYIAIVVSAVALVALAIGVVLKREELFEEEPGLAPAEAGAGPVPTASVVHDRVGDSRGGESRSGDAWSNAQQSVPVTSSPASQGPGGQGAPFAAAATAVPPAVLPGATPPVMRAARPADHPARSDQPARPAAPWEPLTGREPWAAPASGRPDWMPGGPGQRPAGDAVASRDPAPSAWQDASPGRTSLARAGGRTAPDAGTSVPRAWGVPSSDSAQDSGAPASEPAAGSGSTARGWFDRRDKSASDGEPGQPPAAEPTNRTETARRAEPAPRDVVPTVVMPAVPARTEAADKDKDKDATAKAAAKGTAAKDAEDAKAESAAPADADVTEAEPKVAGRSEDPAEGETEADGSKVKQSAEAAPAASLVTVVQGVPRYHQPDCILIRFLPDDDVEKATIAAAKEAGCTPCAVCQPEE